MRTLSVLTLALSLAAAPAAAESWSVEVGGEYDSNPTRATNGGDDAWGARVMLRNELAQPQTRRGVSARMTGLAGARLFPASPEANSFGADVRAQLDWRSPTGWGAGTGAWTRQRFDSGLGQDYVTGGASGGISWASDKLRWQAEGGLAGYLYMPDASLNWLAPTFSTGVSWAGGKGHSAGFTTSLSRRAFSSAAETGERTVDRRDLQVTPSVWGAWRIGRIRLDARYSFSWNTSSTRSKSFNRHGAGASVTALPLETLVLRVSGNASFTGFRRGGELDRSYVIDDENYSSVAVSVEQALGDERVWFEVRYQFTSQIFDGPEVAVFRAHSALLGIAIRSQE